MMDMNMTKAEAEEMRARAIAKAIHLKIVDAIRYILMNDPSVPDEPQRQAPMPGSGFILKMSSVGTTKYTIWVVSADNPTEFAFHYEKNPDGSETYKIFRDGPWVQLLFGLTEALKFRLENRGTLDLLKRYAPL